ncbi:MAG: hypothetical protein JNL48_12775 [Acidobacteria bacterium]|nr:hypothetical protein [Acidobacteriota bacterium]
MCTRCALELQGFKTMARENVTVQVDATVPLDLQMPLATVAEMVTVTGASPVIDTTSANTVTKSGGEQWNGRATFAWLGDAAQGQNIDDNPLKCGFGPTTNGVGFVSDVNVNVSAGRPVAQEQAAHVHVVPRLASARRAQSRSDLESCPSVRHVPHDPGRRRP